MKTKFNIKDYQPLNGFYDLRAFDLSADVFKKLFAVQKFLYDVEQGRKVGNIHPQIDEIRDFSAKYQQALFSFPVIKPELL